jgi:hypothetical protein
MRRAIGNRINDHAILLSGGRVPGNGVDVSVSEVCGHYVYRILSSHPYNRDGVIARMST